MTQNLTEILAGSPWERIVFDSLDTTIPSDRTISELICPPILDRNYAYTILSQYDLPEVERLQAILNSDSSNLWKEITDEVGKLSGNEALYAFLSLRSYRLPPVINSESIDLLRIYSNEIVAKMTEELLATTPFDRTLRGVCSLKGIDYSRVKYHEAVIDYCHQIFPHPLRYQSNVDRDGNPSIQVSSEYSQLRRMEEVPTDEQSGDYRRRRSESERRMAATFSDYRESRLFLENFINQIGELADLLIPQRLDSNSQVVTNNRRQRRDINSENKRVFLLCRCEFCYRFREIGRGRGSGPAWHCGADGCKRRYDTWSKSLRRRGINLETLYQ